MSALVAILDKSLSRREGAPSAFLLSFKATSSRNLVSFIEWTLFFSSNVKVMEMCGPFERSIHQWANGIWGLIAIKEDRVMSEDAAHSLINLWNMCARVPPARGSMATTLDAIVIAFNMFLSNEKGKNATFAILNRLPMSTIKCMANQLETRFRAVKPPYETARVMWTGLQELVLVLLAHPKVYHAFDICMDWRYVLTSSIAVFANPKKFCRDYASSPKSLDKPVLSFMRLVKSDVEGGNGTVRRMAKLFSSSHIRDVSLEYSDRRAHNLIDYVDFLLNWPVKSDALIQSSKWTIALLDSYTCYPPVANTIFYSATKLPSSQIKKMYNDSQLGAVWMIFLELAQQRSTAYSGSGRHSSYNGVGFCHNMNVSSKHFR